MPAGRRWRIPIYIPLWYAGLVATGQIAVRLPEDLLHDLDELVAQGIYESRAAAVRAGAEVITANERRRKIDRAIVEGYRRIPPTAAEMDAGHAPQKVRESVEVPAHLRILRRGRTPQSLGPPDDGASQVQGGR
jgi:Arc/MetJ-type ribon-helix-helix transcriptional regulator